MPIEIDVTQNAMYKWGEEQGEAKGQAIGEVKGEAKTLSRLLVQRFGPLPESVRTRIATADIDLLDRWVDRLDTAAILDDVFADQDL